MLRASLMAHVDNGTYSETLLISRNSKLGALCCFVRFRVLKLDKTGCLSRYMGSAVTLFELTLFSSPVRPLNSI